MNFQDKVKEFQLTSNQPVSAEIVSLTDDEYDFRDTLYREEVKELIDAIVESNRVEILDALCDIKYVTDGTANQIGIKQNDHSNEVSFPFFKNGSLTVNDIIDRFNLLYCIDVHDINELVYSAASKFGFTLGNFKKALDRVHESNMSKFCIDTKTVERTKDFYIKQGIDTISEPRNKVIVVYRKEDRKVLKSIDYWPVKLDDLI